MTEEQKNLLMRDLCARLPYGVKISVEARVETLESADMNDYVVGYSSCLSSGVEDVKPYLLPLSSMTEEQLYEFYCRFVENEIDFDDFKKYYFENGAWHKILTSIDDCYYVVEWFNRKHIDYKGFIHDGLAEDATGKNIY